MRRTSKVMASVMSAAAILVALQPNPAVATNSYNCTTTDHCYGIADWTAPAPAGFEGAWIKLRTNCFTISSPLTDRHQNELWVGNGQPKPNNFWVEAGVSQGIQYSGAHNSSPLFFWADNRPGGGYHEHFGGTAVVLNSYYDVFIEEAGIGTGNWNVQSGYNLLGTSMNNFKGPAHQMDTGTETTTNSAQSYGSSSTLQWWDTGGNLHSNWTSGAFQAVATGNLGTAVVAADYSSVRDGEGSTC